MKENFEIIKAQVCIESVAKYLLGQPVHGLYRFPGERTPSIKIYKETGSFFDFGRAKGGDAVALWAHVCNCDNWTALRELSAVFGISTALNETDKENIVAKIKRQEKAQKEREQAEKRRQKRWVKEVERLQEWRKLCQDLLDSGHLPPFCDVRSWCYSEIQIADHKLDILCEVE
ncbi:hypothetical protein [Merdimonas faecis]|uniref:hypothetical protein n=1 Tax=Merdimonas faecis TaxID=1653435 RepID=UPI0022E4171C|nr:hypothetical protein [Merdimonas faecis]